MKTSPPRLLVQLIGNLDSIALSSNYPLYGVLQLCPSFQFHLLINYYKYQPTAECATDFTLLQKVASQLLQLAISKTIV
jgi:hypothetical protein